MYLSEAKHIIFGTFINSTLPQFIPENPHKFFLPTSCLNVGWVIKPEVSSLFYFPLSPKGRGKIKISQVIQKHARGI